VGLESNDACDYNLMTSLPRHFFQFTYLQRFGTAYQLSDGFTSVHFSCVEIPVSDNRFEKKKLGAKYMALNLLLVWK